MKALKVLHSAERLSGYKDPRRMTPQASWHYLKCTQDR